MADRNPSKMDRARVASRGRDLARQEEPDLTGSTRSRKSELAEANLHPQKSRPLKRRRTWRRTRAQRRAVSRFQLAQPIRPNSPWVLTKRVPTPEEAEWDCRHKRESKN